MLHANFVALCLTEPVELLCRSKFYIAGIGIFGPIICACDLDLDPMTFFIRAWLAFSGDIPDVQIWASYVKAFESVIVWRTYIHTYELQTDRHDRNYEWKCSDLRCIRKPTRSRLSLTHHANKSAEPLSNPAADYIPRRLAGGQI